MEIAYFLEARARRVEGPYDLSLVEGSITTAQDAERIREVRGSRGTLVTIGACATAGGIQALRNFADVERVHRGRLRHARVHRDARDLDADRRRTSRRLRAPGCPINKHQLLEVIGAFSHGAGRAIPTHSVCMECKRRGNVCVMVAHGKPCLGPVTHAGLRRALPDLRPRLLRLLRADGDAEHRVARPAGSRGSAPTTRDLIRVYRTFNANAPAFREESARA